MKVIKIDVERQAVFEIQIEETLQGMYRLLECTMVQVVPFVEIPATDESVNELYVDEEALIMPSVEGFFAVLHGGSNSGYVFKGHGCIAGFDGKESWCNHTADIDRLKAKIRFLSLADLRTFQILN